MMIMMISVLSKHYKACGYVEFFNLDGRKAFYEVFLKNLLFGEHLGILRSKICPKIAMSGPQSISFNNSRKHFWWVRTLFQRI